ncbi:MAG TPA: DUF4917 family protein [Ignavibacteria bacterium]|nr:DUF4917 family protein [Ignavibacteria bacterium]
MAKNEILSYDYVIDYLAKNNRQKHLLLGNGFSMAYDTKIFSNNALYKFIDSIDNPLLKKLFSIIGNKNFEIVMQQLDNFLEIAEIFGTDKELIKKIKDAGNELKNSLIDAVKGLHPEHVFTIPEEKSSACYKWLNEYLSKGGNVFTTNYDLLLYWVLMRNDSQNHTDGFGRDKEDEEFVPYDEANYSELRWGKNKKNQNTHYLHGALPFFDTGVDIIKEEYTTEHFLLQNINERMLHKEYPIFVTSGNGREKLMNIMHNKYLTFCYEQLCNIQGSLVTFGFNFGEYDEHIIEAINKAAKQGTRTGEKLLSIYVGVYSESDAEHIESIRKKFKCKVNLFDSKTAKVWD